MVDSKNASPGIFVTSSPATNFDPIPALARFLHRKFAPVGRLLSSFERGAPTQSWISAPWIQTAPSAAPEETQSQDYPAKTVAPQVCVLS